MSERVTITISAGIADVRRNRADKLNALDAAMFDALLAALDLLAATPDLRCVVLSGEGRAFCAGLDLAELSSSAIGAELAMPSHGAANRLQQVAWGWRQLAVPVIAVAHGVALGGGLQILSGAEIRIAAPDARFAIMEMRWGIVPDMGGFALWRTVLRDDVLRELTYSARAVDAVEAQAIGLVTRVAPDAMGAAMALARSIAGHNPDAIRAAKRLANLAADAGPDAILAAERTEQAALLRSPNQREAVRAGMEGRAPRFRD